MSKDRLSRLQKWLLKRAYEIDGNYVLSRKQIMEGYFGREYNYVEIDEGEYKPIKKPQPNSRTATVSRSLKTLKERDYIRLYVHWKRMSFTEFLSVGLTFGLAMRKTEAREQYENMGFSQSGFSEVGPHDDEMYVKAISLTEKGKEKARELLNVKKCHVAKVDVKQRN